MRAAKIFCVHLEELVVACSNSEELTDVAVTQRSMEWATKCMVSVENSGIVHRKCQE